MKRFLTAGLLLALPAVAWAQCEGITVGQQGPFVVIEHHEDYNCAVFDLHHEVALEGVVLTVTETATADAWADCYCPYQSLVIVGGLDPGDYILVYAYGEWVEGEDPPIFTWCELPFTVDGGQRDHDELMVHVTASGCGMPGTAVPEPPTAPRSLSALKALYD